MTAADMLEFDAFPKHCVKCLNTTNDKGFSFQHERRHLRNEPVLLPGETETAVLQEIRESILHVFCNRCGYERLMKAADWKQP